MELRKRLKALFQAGAPDRSPVVETGASSYPMALPQSNDGEAAKVCFPQADTDFSPSLFWPTEKWKGGSRAGFRHLKNAFTTLYATLEDMGCAVNRTPIESADYIFNWSGKHIDYEERKPSLILEHGWLPRFSYQLSDCGSNARSHVAETYRHGELTKEEKTEVCVFIERVRCLFHRNLPRPASLPVQKPFVLVAFQLATDFNLRFSNSQFAKYYKQDSAGHIDFAQALVDHVEQAELPYRVVYKQHPGDRNNLRSILHIRDQDSLLITNEDKISTHQLFASGLCRLAVSVNSNTLHEALVWNVPAVALGTLVWREKNCGIRPLGQNLKEISSLESYSVVEDDKCLPYLSHLMRNQWFLSDFQNPLIVSTILKTRGRSEPYRLRTELGLGG